MFHSPNVSVIIPVYNGEATIGQCVESLLAQNYPKDRYEIIVVNNNSTDRTVEIVRQYPVILQNEKKQGPAAARNRGLAHVRGEIVAFTDADCFADPRWLRELVDPFSDPTVGGVGGAIESASNATALERYADERPLLNHSFSPSRSLPYLITGNAAYRRELLNQVGGFDERFPLAAGEDTDLSWRILLATPYQLRYAPKAAVYHHHRYTLSGLFKQSFKYATTRHRMHIKYSQYDWYTSHTLVDTYKLYKALIFDLPVWFVGRFLKCLIGYRTRDEMLYPFFEWIRVMGTAFGRIKCTLEHRRFYL